MSRRIVIALTLIFTAFGLGALGYVFVRSLNPSERALADAARLIPDFSIKELKPGEFRRIEIHGLPLMILAPDGTIMNDLAKLDPHTWDPTRASFNAEHNVFIYWGISTRLGCDLTHYPKGAPPRPVEQGRTWHGGYFDRCHDSSYDYAGRTIKTYEYTANGFNAEVPNLRVPQYEIRKDGTVLIMRRH
jgi:Rieske Fe-S protein